jgi:Leucine-rich repeat (LRR) protein
MKKYCLLLMLISLPLCKMVAQEMGVALEPDTRNENGYYTTLSVAKVNAADVRTLDIQKADGDEFLKNAFVFPSLEKMLVHFSNVTSFKSIKENQRLKELRIMYSWRLSSLPDDITEFPHLEKIAVYSCGLQSLPAKFFFNPTLEEVCLCYNNLRDLPEIPADNHIKRLVLDINSLNKLPQHFKNLRELEVLGLKDCLFSTFPKEILLLKNLKVLDLSANNISTLPNSLSKLKKLESLFLVKTGIHELPASLRKSALKYVTISDTGLSQEEKDNIIKSLPKNCQVNWSTALNYTIYVSSCVCLKPSYVE